MATRRSFMFYAVMLGILTMMMPLGTDIFLASMPASGAGSFLTQGQNRGFNSFSMAAGADLALSKSTVLYATVNVEAFSAGSQFGYSGGVRVKF
jgi:hypothetical protein